MRGLSTAEPLWDLSAPCADPPLFAETPIACSRDLAPDPPQASEVVTDSSAPADVAPGLPTTADVVVDSVAEPELGEGVVGPRHVEFRGENPAESPRRPSRKRENADRDHDYDYFSELDTRIAALHSLLEPVDDECRHEACSCRGALAAVP